MDYYVHLSEDTLDKLEKAIDGTKIDVRELEVTQNGTYVAPTGKAYSPVKVEVSMPTITIVNTANVDIAVSGDIEASGEGTYSVTGDATITLTTPAVSEL